jgi:hypothetical protein
MTPKKYDDVIEAVRYTPDGQVDRVRVFQRRGATYSDRILLTRQALIERLKQGKKVAIGQPVPLLASTFDIGGEVRLEGADGREVVVSGDKTRDRDSLEGAPLY